MSVPRAAARLVLAASALLAACGGETPRAVAGDPPVGLLRGGAAQHVAPGPIPFGDGDALLASNDAAARARIACDPETDPGSELGGQPSAGLADVTLSPGACLRRRQASVFDLVDGEVRVATGPLRRRLVVFRGNVFLEAHETNTAGVTFTARADGPALTVRVERGELLLHAPGSTPKDLHYVTLAAGEEATAEAGKEPQKAEVRER